MKRTTDTIIGGEGVIVPSGMTIDIEYLTDENIAALGAQRGLRGGKTGKKVLGLDQGMDDHGEVEAPNDVGEGIPQAITVDNHKTNYMSYNYTVLLCLTEY